MDEIVFGKNPAKEALRAGREINKAFFLKGGHGFDEIISQVKVKKIPYQFLERDKLDAIAKNDKHQGVVLFSAPIAYVEIDEILQIAKDRGEDPFIVILDGVSDPHNLGAILRTAECCGVHGVVIPKRRAVPITEIVAKSSAGAIEYMPIARVTNINDTIERLKEERVWVTGLDSDGDKDLFSADLGGGVALVLGGEGEGLPRLVKENCDFLVKIPMKGKIESLNVSVSAALAMYEVVRRRMG